MKIKFNNLHLIATVVLTVLLLFNIVACGSVQQTNPIYLDAQKLADQVLNSSTISEDQKTVFANRFSALKQEQQTLWKIAGQVDNGQCGGDCIASYNAEVTAWQSKLQTFIQDAQQALNAAPK